MDIDVERNAYGRQIDSRVTRLTPEAEFAARTHPGEMEAVFIRAPVIRRVGPRRVSSPVTRATRSWSSKAGIWWPPSIRS